MKILMLADASSPHTDRWLGRLGALGHDLTLASFQEPWDRNREFVRLCGRGKPMYWRAGPQVRKIAARHDAVLAHFLPGYGLAAWRARVPFALVLWGSDILVWPFRDRFRFGIANQILASARWVFADSITVRRILQLNFGYLPERVSVFPFGPEEDALSPGPVEKDEDLVVFPRAAERIYSPRVAIEALGSLAAKGHSLRAVFTMGGALAKKCVALAKSFGVQVEFKTPLPRRDYLDLMARAGIYLSLALSDATPVSLLEAMALETFPIVSDLPAIREWILDGVNGLLVDPRSPDAVTFALERALCDRDLVERARVINRKLMADRGPWTDNLPGLVDVLSGLGEMKPPEPAQGRRGDFWSYP